MMCHLVTNVSQVVLAFGATSVEASAVTSRLVSDTVPVTDPLELS